MSDDLSQRRELAKNTRETREFHAADLEVRAGEGDGRTIVGLAAPFNSPAEIHDAFGSYQETLMPGSFARTVTERGDRIQLYAMHNRTMFPLGTIPRLSESVRGLEMEGRVSDTTAGNDALTLIRDGVVGGLSIGFQVIRQEWNADYSERTIHEVRLMEISLVTEPAYSDALVSSVREASDLEPTPARSATLAAELLSLYERAPEGATFARTALPFMAETETP